MPKIVPKIAPTPASPSATYAGAGERGSFGGGLVAGGGAVSAGGGAAATGGGAASFSVIARSLDSPKFTSTSSEAVSNPSALAEILCLPGGTLSSLPGCGAPSTASFRFGGLAGVVATLTFAGV